MIKILAKIAHDKLLHYFYGSILAHGMITVNVDYISATILLFSVALAKEFWDRSQGRKFCWWDIAFTMLPLVLIFIQNLLNK